MRQTSMASPAIRRHVRFSAWLCGEVHDLNRSVRRNYDLYLLLLPVIAYYVIFSYLPMYGLQIAFKDYSVGLGILKSPWVGLKHLNRFVSSFYFNRVIGNTLSMSVYSLLLGIPAPLILALLFDELRGSRLKTVCQMFSYAPNFISVVVLCSMTIMFLTPGTGFIDAILRIFGYSAQTSILASPVSFNHIYAWTGVWQTIGWNSVIYTAALAGTSPELYEVARLDGASRLKQIWHVTIPSILPTIVILAIMAIGNVLNVGYEKVFLLQNTSNLSASEVISTYVFKTGLEKAQYSFASMVGLFNNVINFAILILANFMSRRLTETALW